MKIKEGMVRGVRGYGTGYVKGEEKIKIEFEASAGVKEEYEEIIIEGEPPVHWKNLRGTPGDQATAAVILNLIPKILGEEPGLKLVTELPSPSFSLGV